ncbi:MAG: sarcosine oxidase subunit delta [Gammaproteobacteria bacterium]|nr:sarcosine oxidase subunit delta [Gammaproteobacteria bacterium]
MFVIECPWCGKRDQSEFITHGEAHIARPTNGHEMTDAEWGDYVFFRDNPKGITRERWIHTHGCARWFNVMRHTVTEEIFATYKPTDPKPELPEGSE